MQWLFGLIKEWLEVYLQGMIVIWSGALVDIPNGWALCDGTQGTPDLSQRFVRNVGGSLVPGQAGGTLDHSHSFAGVGHTHPFIDGPSGWTTGITKRNDITGTGTAHGNTDVTANLPPYYVLAYIMKL